MLRYRLSYLADDVLVVTWQAAFVYDAEDLQAALEILEFANSQLLQFRYYDDLLDTELTRTYSPVQHARWRDALIGGRYTKRPTGYIRCSSTSTRSPNARRTRSRMVGDIYAARVFQLAAKRGVDSWRLAVEEKLRTLDAVYRSIVEEVNMARGHFLELTIVLILLFELALFFMGIMT